MKRVALVGFAIWLAATLALRLGGQLVLRGSGVSTLLLYAVSLPLMVLVARAVLGSTSNRALAAIALVTPGMLLDSLTTIWFSRIFPNIRADSAPVFGGWLLFCNVVVLLTAALMRPRPTG